MRWLGKILYTVAVVILSIFLSLNLLFVAVRVLGRTDYPELFGWSQSIVLSGSMEPAFSAGDLIIVHREAAYQKGDIISYPEDGASITHRIVEERDDGYITRGDANNASDQKPVAKDQVYGKVKAVIPGAGYIALFFRGRRGILLLALAAVLLIWGKDLLEFVHRAGRRMTG